MSIYLAKEWEVRALLAGRMTRLVVPFLKPPEPLMGPSLGLWLKRGKYLWRVSEPVSTKIAEICPFVGEVESKPPASMRGELRFSRRIASVTAKRLPDLTPEDAIGCGLGVITKDGTLFKHGIPDRDGLPGTDNTGWPWHEWKVDPFAALLRALTERYKAVDWVWIIGLDVSSV